ncbi:hypothetical protein [Anderseniella sp. Alg231-50]|uniref:hypothetical protein n=1 Tax=Anderseniella sp. Alg231-50 TaxID=1922226 RepID=UPI000D5547D2
MAGGVAEKRSRTGTVAVTATVLVMAMFGGGAVAQGDNEAAAADLARVPACINNKGEQVQFNTTDRGRPGLAAGMAIRDGNGKPVVLRSNFASAPREFQQFIDRHECAHHQTGDVDRPHPPRNGPEHLMNEAISDCVSIRRLRDEEGFGKPAFDKVTAALRADMAKIGFPEISIASRIRNISGCFDNPASAEDLIRQVLQQRGLPPQ